MSVCPVPASALPVAPHVWFVLLGLVVLASVVGVLAARRRLVASAALVALHLAVAGVVLIAGAELVAMALAVLGAVVGSVGLLAGGRAGPRAGGVRRRNAVAAVLGGVLVAVATGVPAVVEAGGATLGATQPPGSAAALAGPLLGGGALLVDATALVLAVLALSARDGREAR